MSNPDHLVLRILGEGRINVDEAVALLSAVGGRIAVRPRRVIAYSTPAATDHFLPVSLTTAWSGSIREVI